MIEGYKKIDLEEVRCMKNLAALLCYCMLCLGVGWPDWLVNKTTVLFSPDDAPINVLLDMINNARERIYVAVYMFTDKRLALALARASKRKLDVQVIIDQESTKEQFFGKASLLAQYDIPVHVFTSYQKKTASRFASRALMHNKFALIDQVVWTGSFNWTRKANNDNEENVIICDELPCVKRYVERFDVLKKRSIPFVVGAA